MRSVPLSFAFYICRWALYVGWCANERSKYNHAGGGGGGGGGGGDSDGAGVPLFARFSRPGVGVLFVDLTSTALCQFNESCSACRVL